MNSLTTSFLRDRTGAAAAEMALMLPLLVVLLFAGVEGGYFLWSEHKVVKAVRDGARYAGRQSFGTVHCGGSLDNADTVRTLVRTGTIDSTATPIVPGWTAATAGAGGTNPITISIDCDASTTTGIYASQTNGAPRVTVSARVEYPDLFGSIGFPTDGLTLNAQAQAAVMGL